MFFFHFHTSFIFSSSAIVVLGGFLQFVLYYTVRVYAVSQCIATEEMYNYISTVMSYILGQAPFSFIVCGGSIASFLGSPPLCVLALDL